MSTAGTGVPALVGVVHLEALPGSPRWAGPEHASVDQVAEHAARDARALAEAGFDAVLVENFGDVPFARGRVEPVTVAAMTAAALAARAAAPGLALGINVLRNDGLSALGIAVATGASFIRVNVHTGGRLTDQGIIEGDAYALCRARRALEADHVLLFCDVDVKHSAPLAELRREDETRDLVERGLADAVLITGRGTGQSVERAHLDAVLGSSRAPVLVASGVDPDALEQLTGAAGVVVGSALRADGCAGGAIDPRRAQSFAKRFRAFQRAAKEATRH